MAWTLKELSMDETRKKIDGLLSQFKLPPFARISWEKDELCVHIDKGGKSEFRLSFQKDGDCINIKETKRQVALLHKPFASQVQKVVDDTLKKVGAKNVA